MILAATGHRPHKLGGYEIAVAAKLHRIAVGAISEMKPDKIISGMALGWDQAVAEAAVFLNIPFIAAVPFVGFEMRWPSESKAMYRALLQQAERVELLESGGYAPWKLFARNKWMVDHADHMLALWDGSSGGTANTVELANKKPIPITNIWDEWNR